MTPDSWTIIGTGIVILIAIATSNYRLRNEIRDVRGEIRDVRGEVKELRERMARLETELRERMAKVEGLLEGLREAISGRHVA